MRILGFAELLCYIAIIAMPLGLILKQTYIEDPL